MNARRITLRISTITMPYVTSSDLPGVKDIAEYEHSAGEQRQREDKGHETGINYPVAFDPTGQIADLFETMVIPTTALIGRDGRVLWIRQGIIEQGDRELAQKIQAAL